MTTIEVTGDYLVRSSKDLQFIDEAAFVLEQVTNTPPSLSNEGKITVTGTEDGGDIIAIEDGPGGFHGGLIWNKVGASITVVNSSDYGSATGYSCGAWGERLQNDGLFQVTAIGEAIGEDTWSVDSEFTNNGDFLIAGDDSASGVVLVNGGKFTNTGTFIVNGGQYGADGVSVGYSPLAFNNSGSIIVIDKSSDVQSVAVDCGGASAVCVNTGLVQGEVAFSSWAGVELTNSGTIRGEIALEGGAERISNSGIINGVITLGVEDDFIKNDGLIKGDVHLGIGQDHFISGDASLVQGSVYGGLGDDTLQGTIGADVFYGDDGQDSGQDGNDSISGGGGADKLYGNDGNDTLNGGSANDTLTGGEGDDRINGGAGHDQASYIYADTGVTVDLNLTGAQDTHGDQIDTLVSIEDLMGSTHADNLTGNSNANALFGGDGGDTLKGGGGDDTLDGGGSSDTLIGGAGDDSLSGGASADVLAGGGGQDTLSGGAGGDIFVFTSIAHSTVAAPDLITDLGSTDIINLSVIDADTTTAGDQAFRLVSGFDKHAGELVLSYDKATNLTTMSGDVNGDGKADFAVQLTGDHHDFTVFAL